MRLSLLHSAWTNNSTLRAESANLTGGLSSRCSCSHCISASVRPEEDFVKEAQHERHLPSSSGRLVCVFLWQIWLEYVRQTTDVQPWNVYMCFYFTEVYMTILRWGTYNHKLLFNIIYKDQGIVIVWFDSIDCFKSKPNCIPFFHWKLQLCIQEALFGWNLGRSTQICAVVVFAQVNKPSDYKIQFCFQ